MFRKEVLLFNNLIQRLCLYLHKKKFVTPETQKPNILMEKECRRLGIQSFFFFPCNEK